MSSPGTGPESKTANTKNWSGARVSNTAIDTKEPSRFSPGRTGPDPKRSVTLQYGSAICCRSVKVLALRVRVVHVEHFASQGASVPQWLGLKKHDLGLLGDRG